MQETDNKNQKDEDILASLRFNVMPDLEGIGHTPSPTPPAPKPVSSVPTPVAPPRPAVPMPPKPSNSVPPKPTLTNEIKERRENTVHPGGQTNTDTATSVPNKRKVLIMAASAALVLVLAAGGIIFWQQNKSESSAQNPPSGGEETNNPVVPLVPDEPVDTDEDGLTDEEEDELLSDSDNPDSDSDGLADGDEVNYFTTDPTKADTDDDSYLDTGELQNGYSPVRIEGSRLTDTEVADIVDLFTEDDLHSITAESLLEGDFWKSKVKSPGDESSQNSSPKLAYLDPIYKYQLVLSGEWTVSGENTQNVYFTEKNSDSATYVQIQAFVGVDDTGEPNNEGLLESETKRITDFADSGLRVSKSTLSGISGYRLAWDSKREGSNGSFLISSAIEYLIPVEEATFIVTVGCSSTGTTVCDEAETIEKNLKTGLQF